MQPLSFIRLPNGFWGRPDPFPTHSSVFCPRFDPDPWMDVRASITINYRLSRNALFSAQSGFQNDALVATGNLNVSLVYAPGMGHNGVALSRYNDGAVRFLDRHLNGSVGNRPHTLVDAIRALRITAGLVVSTSVDTADVRQGEDVRITISDVAGILRQIPGNGSIVH